MIDVNRQLADIERIIGAGLSENARTELREWLEWQKVLTRMDFAIGMIEDGNKEYQARERRKKKKSQHSKRVSAKHNDFQD